MNPREAFATDTGRLARALRELAGEPDPSFGLLVSRLDGVSPPDVVAGLAPHCAAGDRLGDLARRLSAEAAIPGCQPVPQGQELPLPHPLDHEWRFTEATVASLLQEAIACTELGEAVLLYGTPTLGVAAAASSHPRRFTCVLADNVVGETIKTLTLGDGRFHFPLGTPAAAAILDPPWYPAIFRDMMVDCAARCRIGARILMVLPPAGVRPSARRDASDLTRLAEGCGLLLRETRWQGAAYRTPLFELAAFEAAGLGARLPSWRHGDLLVFDKTAPGLVPRVKTKATNALELTSGGVRLRLEASPGRGWKGLSALAPGEVFPSVSMRTPGRMDANLWTTTNRAFSVEPRTAYHSMLTLAERRGLVLPPGLTPQADAVWRGQNVDAIQALSHELESLIRRETADAERLVGGTSWLHSINDVRCSSISLPAFLAAMAGRHA